MDMKVSSTIGYERAHNPLLAETDAGAFAERVLAALPPQPPNFAAIVELNHGPFVVDAVPAPPLTPRQVDAHQRAGALVVDVRTDLQFDDAHIPGAICNPAVRAGFGTKLAWISEPGQDICFAGRDDDDARRAIRLAGAIGIRSVAGYLSGGMTSWREEKRPTAGVERIDAAGFAQVLAADPDIQVLDVRARGEFEDGHLAGSVNVAYHDIHGIPDGIDPARPIAAICSSGQRSALAGSLLLRAGAERVMHVAAGGVATVAAAGHPLESGAVRAPRG
jgi:rhodanese-related sulfurtransferase